ncbi:unnamed protein product, partial [Prorocentrum cordatum]
MLVKAQSVAERRAAAAQMQGGQAELKDNMLAVQRPSQLDLLDIGGAEDSPLGRATEKEGGAVYRMGLWKKYDFQKASAVARAKAPIEARRPRRVRIFPPCAPISILQALNQKSDQQITNLKMKIAWGTTVMNNMIEVGLHALRLGCELSLEQPANAASLRAAQSPMNLGKQLYGVTAAGCAWGMRDSETGQAVYKKWRFLVPNRRPAERVAGSVKYPDALCRALSWEVLAHALVSGITAGASEIEGALKKLTEGRVEQAEVMATEKDAETEGPTDELRKSVRLKLHRAFK